ncbi:MAG TPA: CaiB/BaiF CoA-transferase family protein [Polyangiaceae bacterium]|nr:CaiB/BaiF CoA-transferase family protein [Polyangiaceae bacterium]
MQSALAGIRVLDLSRLLPGPFASLVLADLGAEVDKLEDAEAGDYLRHMPPQVASPTPGVEATSAIFLALNRNKRSACVDLKKPEGREALLRLLPRYDVVLEQFRPKVMDRLGLSHEALLEKNPRLVVCALTGYGQTGPLALRAGHDIDYLARAGILGFHGPAGAPPQPPGFQLADVSGGLWSVIGILAALAERARTGKGKVVDVSMTEASMGFGIASLGMLFGGTTPARGDEPITGGIAAYNTYATKDGKFMALGALEPKFWLAFATGVGLPADMSGIVPGPHQAELKQKVAEIFASRTRAEWEAFAGERDCCLEPVLEPGELASDAHLAARGVFFEAESPWGKLRQLKLPIADATARMPPPQQGEHTEAILREAGYDDEGIAKLRAAGAIR